MKMETEEQIVIDSQAILRQLRRMNGRIKRVDAIDEDGYTLDAYGMELELQGAHDGFHCAQAFSGKPLTIDSGEANHNISEPKVYEAEAFIGDILNSEIGIVEEAKQSIQESIDTLKAFGLLELYPLDVVNIEQIQLDIQWTIDSLKNCQRSSE